MNMTWIREEVKAKTKEGKTPLHWITAIAPDHVKEVLEALLEYGVDLQATDQYGNRALDYAIMDDNEELALLLLSKGKMH